MSRVHPESWGLLVEHLSKIRQCRIIKDGQREAGREESGCKLGLAGRAFEQHTTALCLLGLLPQILIAADPLSFSTLSYWRTPHSSSQAPPPRLILRSTYTRAYTPSQDPIPRSQSTPSPKAYISGARKVTPLILGRRRGISNERNGEGKRGEGSRQKQPHERDWEEGVPASPCPPRHARCYGAGTHCG